MTAEPPLRVLEVIQRFFPEIGGAETHVYEVSRRLADRGDMDVTVFATDRSNELPRSERTEGFGIIRRRAWPRKRDYYFAPGVLRVISRGNWDLVHFQGIHTFVPILGMLAARRARIPYVLTFHSGGHSSPSRGRIRNLQWRCLTPLLRGARRLIGVSRFESRLFQDRTGIPAERFTVIRNGGSLATSPDPVAPVPGRLVSSGRLERYKGHHRVIEALAVLRQSDSAAHLVILGAGPYENELLALARRLQVADAVSIRHLPPADRAGMARELASASVVAAFSDYEAHPIGVMEALALGVPVVGYDIAGIADLVEDGMVTGLTPGAPADVAATALRRAMTEPRAATGAADLELPTWEQSTDLIAGVYLAAVGR
jgi:glycosyltransferase involved in cell wall biosynthesis